MALDREFWRPTRKSPAEKTNLPMAGERLSPTCSLSTWQNIETFSFAASGIGVADRHII